MVVEVELTEAEPPEGVIIIVTQIVISLSIYR